MSTINYKRDIPQDVSIVDLEMDSRGYAIVALKTTTGAPSNSTLAGLFEKGAQIHNIYDGTWYENTGTIASPTWSLVPSTGSGITTLTGDVAAGPGTGSQATTIGAGKVTLVKLAAAIAPSHVVKFAGTGSGGTTAVRAYTVTGALATDVASAVIRASTNVVSIEKAVLTTDTLTITFSADPGGATTVDYSVLRAV